MLRLLSFQESSQSKPLEKSMVFSVDLRKPRWLLRLAYTKFRVVRSAGIFWRNFRHIGEFPGEKASGVLSLFFMGISLRRLVNV